MEKEIIFAVLFLGFILAGISFVLAEKLEINTDDLKIDDNGVKFRIFLYDDSNNKINGEVSYNIENYHSKIVGEGKASSGEEIDLKFPKNPIQGPWKINAAYKEVKTSELFSVGDIKKIDIKLEKDSLIIENIGNIPYDNNILIYIGEEHQTARVYLEVGQIKKIRLTAPDGKYTVKVDDGTSENKLVFSDVSLTGNVVGLERVVEGGFWKKNPLISLFFVTLILVILVFIGLRIYNRYFMKNSKSRVGKRKR